MALKIVSDKILLSFILVMATLLVVNGTSKTSYWQTIVSNPSIKLKENGKKVCFPNQTNTRESLGNLVTKNISSLCIENTMVVGKLDKVGWSYDFQVSKSVLTVIVTSCSARLMANMLSNFVIFLSDSSLHQTSNYVSHVNECIRYKSGGFKPNEKMTFKCERTVKGRFIYIWGLNNNRIQSAFIDAVSLEFAIEVKTNPSNPVSSANEHGKQYSITFEQLSGWSDGESKGYWIVTLGNTYTVKVVLIGVSNKLIYKLGGLVVDVGTRNRMGKIHYMGNKMSQLSADKTGFIVNVNMKGNSIRIKGKRGNGYLTDSMLNYIEMMCISSGNTLYFKDSIKITKNKWFKKAIKKPSLKGELQVWLDVGKETTGWIMIDLIKRYLVTGVSILSGSNSKVITDLQGLVIATSNFIPQKILSKDEKLEADICSEVGPRVKIVPNKENHMKCLPEPSLGGFVLIYNKLKPLRISSIKLIKVFIKMNGFFYFQFKLPFYPDIPDKPPTTKIKILTFFVQTQYTHVKSGYWIIDLLSPRKVDAVVVTAGVTSTTTNSFIIFVQDSFSDDLMDVCARFMSTKFKRKTSKYFKCTPDPRTGRYVIVANPNEGFLVDSISKIQVWFYNGRKESGDSSIQHHKLPPAKYDRHFLMQIDWTIIYNKLRFSAHPKGWWLFDIGSRVQVNGLVLVLKYDNKVLSAFKDVYVGLTNIRDDVTPSVCEYHTQTYGVTRKVANSYEFVCCNLYTYRYIIIRSKLSCEKYNLQTINSVEIHVKQNGYSKKALIDVSTLTKQLYTSKFLLKGSVNVRLYKISGMYVYAFDFHPSVEVTLLELTVKYNTKISEIEILMNKQNNFKNGYKTCFWFKADKAQAFYKGSTYKFRCSYSGASFRYVFIKVQKDSIQTIRFNLKNQKHFEWRTKDSLIINKSTPRSILFRSSPVNRPRGEQGGKQCPSGYKLLSNNCYKPVLTKLYWEQAQQNCRKEGAQLATIMNKSQHKAAYSIFNSIKSRCFTANHGYNFWVGGARCNGELRWFPKGTKGFHPNQKICPKDSLVMKYTNWHIHNPGYSEHCVEMLNSGWKWNDVPCHYAKMCSLCQTNPK